MKPRTDNLTRFGHCVRRAVRALAPALLLLASSLRAHADWPLIRGDANATGAVTTPLKAPLDILWTYESEESAFEATASIVDGIVYVGDVDGTFHAVKLSDGSSAWTRKFDDSGFIAGSAIRDGRIYCTDYNGVVRALDVADGKELWKFETETSLYAAPNVDGEHVLIATDSGELIALDAATGNEVWKFTIDQPLRSWPTVVEGRVLVAGCDGLLHSVDAASGKDMESIDIGGPADGMPAVVDGRVYFCTAGGTFHGMTIKPLASVWQYGQKGKSEQIHAAAVNEKVIVLGTHDKTVVGLDPATGKELWTFRLRARAESSPVIVGSLAFAGTIRGRFHAVDLATGKEVWQTDVGGQFIASPAVSDARLVIGNTDGVLYCIGSKK